MNHSSFKRPVIERRPMPAPLPVRRVALTVISDSVTAQPKTEIVRSEAYRRLVAALPCKACGIQGYSQAAHLPPESKGTKQDDRLIFALCCTRPGITGCHADYDHYRMFTRLVAMTVGRAWAADTQRQIIAMGMWPKGVPIYEEKQPVDQSGWSQAAINSGAKE